MPKLLDTILKVGTEDVSKVMLNGVEIWSSTPPVFEPVDIGLSVKWANMNIGATEPSDYGNYYAWGELYTKDDYSEETYTYTVWSIETLPPTDDVATQELGSDWRMPTLNEIEELLDTYSNSNYQWTWKSINGHNGWEIKFLLNNNSIFLPAAGYMDGGLIDDNDFGHYWSSSISRYQGSHKAQGYYFDEFDSYDESYDRYCGLSVRPVYTL